MAKAIRDGDMLLIRDEALWVRIHQHGLARPVLVDFGDRHGRFGGGALTLDYEEYRLEIDADGDGQWIVMDGEDPLASIHPLTVPTNVRDHLDTVADRVLDGYEQGVKL